MSTLEDVLDQLYYSATDERDKGDKFERLMLQFFKTDLFWTDRFSDVWMWMDWPERHGRRDTGIDLVATQACVIGCLADSCAPGPSCRYLRCVRPPPAPSSAQRRRRRSGLSGARTKPDAASTRPQRHRDP